MKKIYKLLKEYMKADFNVGVYVSVALFLTFGIILNYSFDFKEKFIFDFSHSNQYFLRWLAFFAVSYFFVLFIESLWRKDISPFKNKKFLVFISFALIMLTLDSYLRDHFLQIFEHLKLPRQLLRWSYYVFVNLNQILFLFLIFLVFRKIADRKDSFSYGLTNKNASTKPYLFILLMLAPFIIFASFQPDFLKSYPIYKDNFQRVSEVWNPAYAISSFELSYALRFVSVEFFFRGFLVIGLVKLIGQRAILPMVVLYAFWHFGKPVAETIAAGFGAYILGIIALKTQSIKGGIIVHMGIAILMEAAAYLQIYS
jgi:hypothetical protein